MHPLKTTFLLKRQLISVQIQYCLTLPNFFSMYAFRLKQQFDLLLNMRGKKISNNQQFPEQPVLKKLNSKGGIKQRLIDIRSLQSRQKPIHHQAPMQSPRMHKVNYVSSAIDYEIPKKERKALKFVPIGEAAHEKEKPNQPQFKYQRNAESRQFLQNRENNFILKKNTNPQQKIKIFSAQNNQKSWSRSDNNSSKKRTGIELTKTLLKRISGMYTDKDFQNKYSYLNKTSKEQTTKMTLSGRVYDQYQISELDFLSNNHTFNTSNQNPLSFNDSGQWAKPNDSQKRISINQINHSYERLLKNSRQEDILNFDQSKKEIKKLQKVKSCQIIPNSRPLSRSIEVGEQPPQRHQPRRCQMNSPSEGQKYVIQSKGKTLQQLSVKQSMVMGYENYYK